VLLDMPVPEERDVWVGRTAADAPDIDSVVYVTGANLASGAVVPCEIVARQNYDLVAAAVGEPR
jgi:ribosomal protein S12 methylthiotransferase